MMKHQENNKQSLGSVTIKTEPGTSASPVLQRLPSLRPPRDLSLSAYSQKIPNLNQAKNKKIYVPNLNVQRNKPSENVYIKTEPTKPNLQENTERGRGRGKRNLVQLNQGLFAEGIPGQMNLGHSQLSAVTVDKTHNVLRRPTRNLKEDFKIDKKEEEDTMKHLLQDDFIDDPNLEPDFDHCPVTLPLLNSKEDPALRMKCYLKAIDKKEHLTMNDVFCDVSASDPGFIFFQLPNSMPGLKTEEEGDGPKYNSAATSAWQPGETKADNERCLFSSLPGGHIGKLQILKSGRARLVFGNTKMWLEIGTQVAFRQDLMSIDLNRETHSGHMINLGPVSVRMVATPDWEGMMATLKTEKQIANV